MNPEKVPEAPRLPPEELLPWTVPEVRHLLWQLVWTEPASIPHVLAWSQWRRRHHARTKGRHYRRRFTNCELELRL